ncbi:tyrosine-type recombinase/integrase [Pleomorphomonas sp. NRK KF1]|uniref:tyrosine-type recombinase/integrase n=1 Tax=Pleomorphomonas sp. NRK KF1 TaxID=2943000 RepID=UPI0020443481|nr:tyrosine-type recombinase/integrase [Pleomorphomonas sp. NRK KF1]MCM5553335.1 tyrosine-type recombinase/integrase [Pleomorphomonas sp. NRK KF1]
MNDQPKLPYVIFSREDSPSLWIRFSVPGVGQKRICLKTSDEDEAKRRAEIEYQRAIYDAERGTLPGKTSFDRIARQYLEHAVLEAGSNPSKLSKVAADRGVLDRYMVPFFGRSPVTAINVPKLHSYMAWRRSYWTSGPGAKETHIEYERKGRRVIRPAQHIEATLSTLRREAVTMRSVFKHAVRLGYLKASDIPKIDLVAEERNKRPSFTDAEVAKLMQVAEQRMIDVLAPQRRGKPLLNSWKDMNGKEITPSVSRVAYERTVLYWFINIALETGMRPTELFNLDWGHIVGFKEERNKPIVEQRIRILAYGKGKKPQQLVPNIGAATSFAALWDAFQKVHGRAPRDDEPVFVNASGERAQSYKKSLNALLEAAKLKTDVFGQVRSAYSFRHTYATRQLRKGTDVYTLAINMRTSVRMIEMYYSDVVPEDLAKQLEGSYD